MANIYPVILSGGSGTRLWPLSRAALPKQFLPLVSDKTMLQETALRVARPGRRLHAAARGVRQRSTVSWSPSNCARSGIKPDRHPARAGGPQHRAGGGRSRRIACWPSDPTP